MRSNRKLEHPTFAQTVKIIQTMPWTAQDDPEAIIQQHLALGFHYDKAQIHRALDAVTRDPPPTLDRRKAPSGRWT